MNRNVFEIDGLECAYGLTGKSGGNVVLQIERLSIPMGRVTIILGLSGSGKSTLIETLGLMNNTIARGRITCFTGEGSLVFDRETWNRPSFLARIRNRHFSFIFQNDFLMPYYTPEENMLIAKWIQGPGFKAENEADELNRLCRKLGIRPEEINLKKPTGLSVGQKQRLSFIRAVMKNHAVIFGDEPTGNLDEVNSALLLDVLNESVRQNSLRSAILVSHDISLSVAKAGCIIVLSPSTGERYEVRPCNVFTRVETGWINGNPGVVPDHKVEGTIREIVHSGKPVINC